jgi:hypothetical protein
MRKDEYKVNNGQKAKIAILVSELGMDKEVKADLVKQYTDGRVSSTTGMTWKEAQDMITGLSGGGDACNASLQDKKRKLILHYAHQMGWEIESEGTGRRAVDMNRVNGWCEEYGYLHKTLNEYTLAELSKLVWQFEKVYQDYLKAV